MNSPTELDLDEPNGFFASDLGRAVRIGMATTLYLVSFGYILGFESDWMSWIPASLQVPLVLLSALAVLTVSLLWFHSLGLLSKTKEPMAKSAKKTRSTLLWACVVGLVISVALGLSLTSGEVGFNILSDEPVAPIGALLIIFVYVVFGVVATAKWHRNGDEYEVLASKTGALFGFTVYVTLTPAWWLAERASLLPAQEPMIIFGISLAVYTAVWTYARGA